jgi:hypothetical protein
MADRSPETERWARKIATFLIVAFVLGSTAVVLVSMWAFFTWVLSR